MRCRALSCLVVFATIFFQVPRAAAFDWDPVTDAEKSMKSNPIDPGAGAVVLFKRGQIDVIEKSSLFWTTRIQTYVRIKVFNDAGREPANVSVEDTKFVRISKVEGRTILPSGEIIPLDTSKVFRGTAYTEGKNFAMLAIQLHFSVRCSPERSSSIRSRRTRIGFILRPGFSIRAELGTLQSSLKVTIGPRLAMAQFPLETTINKISVSQSDTVKGSQSEFSVKNLRPIVSEPFSLPFRDQATMIIFTPRQLAFGWKRLSAHHEVGRRRQGSDGRIGQHGKKRKGDQKQGQGAGGETSRSAQEGGGDLQIHPAEHHLQQPCRRLSGPARR